MSTLSACLKPFRSLIFLLACWCVCANLQLRCQNTSWRWGVCATVVSFFLLLIVPVVIIDCKSLELLYILVNNSESCLVAGRNEEVGVVHTLTFARNIFLD